MSSANPSNDGFIPSRSFEAPSPSFWQRINPRVVIFAAVVLLIIGAPFYVWLNEVITKGVHDYGSYKEVDLKAMSSFDMDQQNAILQDIPAQFRALEGKEVLMKGEMWDARDAGDQTLSHFQLVYSISKCCFSGPPLAQHFVDVDTVPHAKIHYFPVPVNVWGKLHITFRRDETGVIKSIYHVDVSRVEPIS